MGDGVTLARRLPVRKPVVTGLTPDAGVPAPFPPPMGYRWEFVTSYGERVTSNGDPVVALVRT